MNEIKQKVLIPEYMQKFHCIGSDCEDTCCFGWGVQIDKTTYKKYMNDKKTDLRQDFLQKVVKNTTGLSDYDYARIKLCSDGTCPFLDESKLCRIQLKHGEEYLSTVCTTYPRMSQIIDGVLEKSATLSCPEAARLCLLNPDGVDFVEIEEDLRTRNIIGRSINTNNSDFNNSPEKYFWDLRFFSIQLIKCRDYEMWERLLILGLFYNELQEKVDKNRVGEIPALVESYQDMATSGVFNGILNEFESQTAIQLRLLKEMTSKDIFNIKTQKRFMVCLDEFSQGIHSDQTANDEEILDYYKEAYNNYYKPFMDKKGYMLENYLVNIMFKNLFPFSGKNGLFENYLIIALHYSIIKMILIGMSGYYKQDFNEKHVIKLIQSFGKVLEHDRYFFKLAFDALEKSGFKELSHIAILIKDL